MIRFTYDGKEFEFRGEYRSPQKGDQFLTDIGLIMTRMLSGDFPVRAIVHPVPVIHEFGGIKFVETGEVRTAQPGEWFKYKTEERIHFFDHETLNTVMILKPYKE